MCCRDDPLFVNKSSSASHVREARLVKFSDGYLHVQSYKVVRAYCLDPMLFFTPGSEDKNFPNQNFPDCKILHKVGKFSRHKLNKNYRVFLKAGNFPKVRQPSVVNICLNPIL